MASAYPASAAMEYTNMVTYRVISHTYSTSDPVEQPDKEFTLFPQLPKKIRIKIWKLAMKQEVRIVHVRPQGLNHIETPKPGCPAGRNVGLTIKIRGRLYEQVPPYFFVNREARKVAWRHFRIRFFVRQKFRECIWRPWQTTITRVLMSPQDILVSWFTISLVKLGRLIFDVEFSPSAAKVHNVLVNPWDAYDPQKRLRQDTEMFRAGLYLVDKMHNVDNLQKLLLIAQPLEMPMKFLDYVPRRAEHVWVDEANEACKNSTRAQRIMEKFAEVGANFLVIEDNQAHFGLWPLLVNE